MNIPNVVSLKLSALRKRIIESDFSSGDWIALGDVSRFSSIVDEHPRLLRSLRFGDDDYTGHVYSVLRSMYERDPQVIGVIEQFMNQNFPDESTKHGSVVSSGVRLTVTPTVFDPPSDLRIDESLVSVMMPYDEAFEPIWQTIERSCKEVGVRCQRVKNIWEADTIIKDVFSLLFRSSVVIVDLSGKNPNVMYETGIAHTLGRAVIPISQSVSDVPFNLKHHRVLTYLANAEGLRQLKTMLVDRLSTLFPKNDVRPDEPNQDVDIFDDDVPF